MVIKSATHAVSLGDRPSIQSPYREKLRKPSATILAESDYLGTSPQLSDFLALPTAGLSPWTVESSSKIRIRSEKKDDERLIPLFPELRTLLTEAFEHPDAVGQRFVIMRYRDTNANLRTQLNRIIRRAGLTPWPRLFQNLRASRETELAAQFPMHVVCQWIGNSATVAAAHYLQVRDSDFTAASRPNDAPRNAQTMQMTQETTRPASANVVQQGPENEKSPDFSERRPSLNLTDQCRDNYPVLLAGLEPAATGL